MGGVSPGATAPLVLPRMPDTDLQDGAAASFATTAAVPPRPPHGAFAGTDFDALPVDGALRPATRRTAVNAGPAFDACHGGMVLRAVLLVHAGVAVGVAFGAVGSSPAGRRGAGVERRLSGSAVVAVAVCALKDVLARWPAPVSSLTAGGDSRPLRRRLLEAAGELRPGRLADGRGFAAGRWVAPALAGAAFAALLVGWLRLRATAQQPADASARLAELQSRIRPHFLFNR